jgi:hypothetical protein
MILIKNPSIKKQLEIIKGSIKTIDQKFEYRGYHFFRWTIFTFGSIGFIGFLNRNRIKDYLSNTGTEVTIRTLKDPDTKGSTKEFLTKVLEDPETKEIVTKFLIDLYKDPIVRTSSEKFFKDLGKSSAKHVLESEEIKDISVKWSRNVVYKAFIPNFVRFF